MEENINGILKYIYILKQKIPKLLRRDLMRLRESDDGNFGMGFIFSSMAVAGVIAVSLNLGIGYNTKRMLQQATDSAATAAANAIMSGSTDVNQITAIANRFLKSNLSEMGATFETPEVFVSISTVVPKSVTVTARTVMPTMMTKMVGLGQVPIAAKTVVSLGSGETYYQIQFLVDNSGSMSIGGTASDITALESNSKVQCAFACHDPNAVRKVPNGVVNDKSVLAASLGLKLKFDYVKTAIASFMSQILPSMKLN